MKALKKDLGNEKFDRFMAVYGDTTLIFAIDDTGSMHNEIQAAKDIAKSIVNTAREIRVDYILSPFNDPGNLFLFKLSQIILLLSYSHTIFLQKDI